MLSHGQEIAALTFLADGEQMEGETADLGFVRPYMPPMTEEFFMAAVTDWVRSLLPVGERARPAHADLAVAIEVFVSAWLMFSADALLDPADKRTGDAFAEMANEVAKTEDPPSRGTP